MGNVRNFLGLSHAQCRQSSSYAGLEQEYLYRLVKRLSGEM
jgi:hypothetical protein